MTVDPDVSVGIGVVVTFVGAVVYAGPAAWERMWAALTRRLFEHWPVWP